MIEVLVLGLEYDMLKVMQVPPLALLFFRDFSLLSIPEWIKVG